MVDPDRPTNDSIIRRLRFAWRIPRATDTHSEYVIHVAFPLQQWLREQAPVLRYSTMPGLLKQKF